MNSVQEWHMLHEAETAGTLTPTMLNNLPTVDVRGPNAFGPRFEIDLNANHLDDWSFQVRGVIDPEVLTPFPASGTTDPEAYREDLANNGIILRVSHSDNKPHVLTVAAALQEVLPYPHKVAIEGIDPASVEMAVKAYQNGCFKEMEWQIRQWKQLIESGQLPGTPVAVIALRGAEPYVPMLLKAGLASGYDSSLVEPQIGALSYGQFVSLNVKRIQLRDKMTGQSVMGFGIRDIHVPLSLGSDIKAISLLTPDDVMAVGVTGAAIRSFMQLIQGVEISSMASAFVAGTAPALAALVRREPAMIPTAVLMSGIVHGLNERGYMVQKSQPGQGTKLAFGDVGDLLVRNKPSFVGAMERYLLTHPYLYS